ncbi:MAG: hypothetical protein IKP77_06615 [Acholeplasmatales bacterium]|nr:hypothetical protein [Acholeplasmatales bacterium]
MKISDSAKEYFISQFDDYINGIVININTSCCVIGEDIRIGFEHIVGNYIIVNDIKVKYDSYYEDYLKNLLVDFKNNMIVFEEII